MGSRIRLSANANQEVPLIETSDLLTALCCFKQRLGESEAVCVH